MTKLPIILAACALAMSTMLNVYAAPPNATSSAKKTQKPAAQEPERDVPYEELAKFKGQRIIVHSTIGTTRSGVLTRYSQTQIDIALDGSGADFTFIRDSIKSVGIPITPEPEQSSDSAKKN